MLSFFKKNKKQPQSIICFDVLYALDQYLYENGGLSFTLTGLPGNVSVNLFSFPSSFSDEKAIAGLRKHQLTNSFELLNTFYEKVNISPVDTASITKGAEFFYIEIRFSMLPDEEARKIITSTEQMFIITFCNVNSEQINDFRIAEYSGFFYDYIRAFMNTTAFFPEELSEKKDLHKKEQLEQVLFNICKLKNLPIPAAVDTKAFKKSLVQPAVFNDYVSWVNLITQNSLQQEAAVQIAKDLQNNIQNDNSDKDEEDTFPYYFIDLDEIHYFFWNSDWKFEPEDVIYFLSAMLGSPFQFNYPADTWSHDLFPYIQQALAAHNRELMSFNTMSDSYLFFIIDKKKKSEFLALSQRLNIAIDTLW